MIHSLLKYAICFTFHGAVCLQYTPGSCFNAMDIAYSNQVISWVTGILYGGVNGCVKECSITISQHGWRSTICLRLTKHSMNKIKKDLSRRTSIWKRLFRQHIFQTKYSFLFEIHISHIKQSKRIIVDIVLYFFNTLTLYGAVDKQFAPVSSVEACHGALTKHGIARVA